MRDRTPIPADEEQPPPDPEDEEFQRRSKLARDVAASLRLLGLKCQIVNGGGESPSGKPS